jgi:hypothetical protein
VFVSESRVFGKKQLRQNDVFVDAHFLHPTHGSHFFYAFNAYPIMQRLQFYPSLQVIQATGQTMMFPEASVAKNDPP